MEISKYFKELIKDFFKACGALMVVVAVFFRIYSKDAFDISVFWQIMIIASAYTFFKFAFVNKLELEKNVQMVSFFVLSTLGDLMVISWLFFFSPGRLKDIELIIIYIVTVVVVKVGVYAMTYIDGQKQAKMLNHKLSDYKKGSNK